MTDSNIPLWKGAPFIRFITPFIIGILYQWHAKPPLYLIWVLLLLSISLLSLLHFSKIFIRFKFYWITGVCIVCSFISAGAIITYYSDISHHPYAISKKYTTASTVKVVLNEPISEKNKSYKAVVSAVSLFKNDIPTSVKGNIICYFQKENNIEALGYGSQIIFKKPLQPIKNSGNPASFDYVRYCAFQGIYYQVYLKPGEYKILPDKKINPLKKLLINVRSWVIKTLNHYIEHDKEAGFAEAVLIGYKDDLDKNLVQSYSNTGVVHVIAISGLHLSLIYLILSLLFKPLKKKKFPKWISPIFIIVGLWLFSLLAGGGPSVLRSAVMFTFIVIGDNLNRKVSIYNTLSASAFLLLCFNPFWLWDVGFQLSYTAVLSIVIFFKPIYHSIYVKNKIVDFIWKLNAVTLSAQILTVPVSIYHFHQFPNLFLLANLIAVPVSSIVLIGEIILCCISFIPLLAKWVGFLLLWTIRLLNRYIENIDALSFSLSDSLQISFIQLVIIFLSIAAFSYWWFEKNKRAFIYGLFFTACFICLRTISFISTNMQKKIIVYNVPQHQAMDFVFGNHYQFIGDSVLFSDDFLQNFHLKPARTLHRVSKINALKEVIHNENLFSFCGKTVLLLDNVFKPKANNQKINIDLLILSKNPKIYLSKLFTFITPKMVVADATNPHWKINYWQKDCDSLHIPFHNVSQQGAFVMRMN